MAIEIETAATCKLRMSRGTNVLSSATGFMVSDGDAYYLVTALHNFTGRHFFTGACLDQDRLATPDCFELTCTVTRGEGQAKSWTVPKIELFDPETQQPFYYFDTTSNGADIAVVEIKPQQNDWQIVSLTDAPQHNWDVSCGGDAFALGYASALDVSGTCIWKKVSIASEPDLAVQNRKLTLIDGLTFSGMSGGPVFIKQSNGSVASGNWEQVTGTPIHILGVYGGRYETDAEKSGMLGYYWPMDAAWTLIKNKTQIGQIDCF